MATQADALYVLTDEDSEMVLTSKGQKLLLPVESDSSVGHVT